MDASSTLVALAFPGAGIQASGYETAFMMQEDAAIRPLLQQASLRVNADLVAAVPGGFEELPQQAGQAFTFAYGVGMAQAVRRRGLNPVAVAGHSLGVYAAVVAAGATGFDEGLALVQTAWRAAAQACAGKGVGMAAIAGLPESEVAALRAVDGESVRIVLVNGTGSVVIAGPMEGIEAALTAARAAGAVRTACLDREVAYHHPLYMSEAAAELRDAAGAMAFCGAEVPVASTVDGRLLTVADEVRDFLAANLCTPIGWPRAMNAFLRLGVTSVVECGPGLTLTRMARFLEPEMAWLNVRRLVKEQA
jgi:[acyl-carrier-protein] S-malonyltransferase